MMRAGLWLPGYFASSNPMHLSDPTASSVRKTPYPLAQHTFGLDYPALHRQKNPILVFRLLPGFLLEHTAMLGRGEWVTIFGGIRGGTKVFLYQFSLQRLCKYCTIRCRVFSSGKRPDPAPILSNACFGLAVSVSTHVTAG